MERARHTVTSALQLAEFFCIWEQLWQVFRESYELVVFCNFSKMSPSASARFRGQEKAFRYLNLDLVLDVSLGNKNWITEGQLEFDSA